MKDPTRIKADLPHTWPVFFAQHGSFTTVQQLTIPALLTGRSALVMAATASGKTEAVIAPLLEQCVRVQRGGRDQEAGLFILKGRADILNFN